MSAKSIKKGSKSRTDIKRLRQMTDDEIDYSDSPPLPQEFWKDAKLIEPPSKKIPISLRVNEKTLIWYKKHGYQKLMNEVLETYMEAARRHR